MTCSAATDVSPALLFSAAAEGRKSSCWPATPAKSNTVGVADARRSTVPAAGQCHFCARLLAPSPTRAVQAQSCTPACKQSAKPRLQRCSCILLPPTRSPKRCKGSLPGQHQACTLTSHLQPTAKAELGPALQLEGPQVGGAAHPLPLHPPGEPQGSGAPPHAPAASQRLLGRLHRPGHGAHSLLTHYCHVASSGSVAVVCGICGLGQEGLGFRV